MIVAGKQVYLPGKYGSEDSKAAYLAVLSSLRANAADRDASSVPLVSFGRGPSVADLISAFLRRGQVDYRKRGRSTDFYEQTFRATNRAVVFFPFLRSRRRFFPAFAVAPSFFSRFCSRVVVFFSLSQSRRRFFSALAVAPLFFSFSLPRCRVDNASRLALRQEDLIARGLARRSTGDDRIGYAEQIVKRGGAPKTTFFLRRLALASLKPLVADARRTFAGAGDGPGRSVAGRGSRARRTPALDAETPATEIRAKVGGETANLGDASCFRFKLRKNAGETRFFAAFPRSAKTRKTPCFPQKIDAK